MSLQVWLPLTKDLRQQGLSNVTVTNNGAIFNSTGKLGGCYSFDGTDDRIAINDISIPINSSSLCCWFKASNTTTADRYIISLNNTGGFSDQQLGVYQYGSGVSLISGGATCFSFTITEDTWYHVCITRKNNTVVTYLNGVEQSTSTASDSLTGTHLCIGARCNSSSGAQAAAMYYFNGKVNDFRLYDHCLSPMEVKELAKGLVLHYPLDRQGWGQDNILLNTGFQSRYTQSTGWDTTKNGTQLANSWGGYNSGVPNPSTVYHAHLKQVNGEWVYEYIKTANENWLGIAQGGLQSKLTAGKTYTFSWEEYRVEGNNYPTGGLYYYKTGATSANFHLGQFGGSSGNILGQWRKFSYTFTAPTDGDYSKNMAWYIYGTSGGNGKMYMRHPKLEEGSIATPWCPNSADALATTVGLNSTTEYDCSGYCNNGTKTGIPIYTSDTSKYAVSTQFTGTQFITADSPTSEGATLALWVKTASTSNAAIAVDYKSKLGFGFYSGVIIPSCNGNIKTTYATTNYTTNQWNHIVVVRNSSSTLQLYINGVLQTNTASAQDCWSGGVIDGLSIAARPNGSSPVSCQVSDVRIYATALSADDVKSLYQNCATIDPDGTIRGQIRS